MTFKLKPGINHCTNAQYHSDKNYLSSSGLKLLQKSAAQFAQERLSPPPAATGTHLDLGSFTHSLLLEPELIAEQYAFFTGFRRAGKEYEAFKAKNPDKEIISLSMKNNGERLAASVKAVPSAIKLLEGGESELSIALTLRDVPVKARFDRINVAAGLIVDVKTSRDPAGKEYFKQTIKDYDYDFSAGQYVEVAEEYYNKPFVFYWLVISKDGTPETRVYKASEATMANGRRKFSDALGKYKKCTASGIWLDEPKPVRATIECIEEI